MQMTLVKHFNHLSHLNYEQVQILNLFVLFSDFTARLDALVCILIPLFERRDHNIKNRVQKVTYFVSEMAVSLSHGLDFEDIESPEMFDV